MNVVPILLTLLLQNKINVRGSIMYILNEIKKYFNGSMFVKSREEIKHFRSIGNLLNLSFLISAVEIISLETANKQIGKIPYVHIFIHAI